MSPSEFPETGRAAYNLGRPARPEADDRLGRSTRILSLLVHETQQRSRRQPGAMPRDSSERLAAFLSRCDDFWMADSHSASGPQGPLSRDAAYQRLVSDLIKQQIDQSVSNDPDSPSRIIDYLDEYADVSFDESALLELIEHEFAARHAMGDWPELDEYIRQFPELEADVRSRLSQARDDVVTRSSVRNVLREDQGSTDDGAGDDSDDPASCPDDAQLAETLREIRPFSNLSRHVREAVAEHAAVRPFAPGDILLRQGEAADALFILLEGTADVWLNDSGKMHPIAHLQRHTVVGELGLVTQEVRSATVTATSPGCAAIIEREEFERLAGRYPRLSIALAELIAERVGTLAIDVLCGKTIDKYLIRRRLGRGATGIVYAAEDDQHRPVALKMLRHDLTFDRHATIRFHQEADIVSELKHPNIVAVLSEFSAYGTSFIAMEMCDGPSLSDLIRTHGALPIPVVEAIVGQLAAGLACAHDAGIAHRDLKPSNVLLTRDGAVKIVDFGLARYMTADDPEMTAFGQVVGTPRYMSPEQITGDRGDERADYFSLGCVIYELLTGKPMYGASRFSELLIERAGWAIPPAKKIRAELPARLYRLLEDLLEHDVDARDCDLSKLAAWAGPIDRKLVEAAIVRDETTAFPGGILPEN